MTRISEGMTRWTVDSGPYEGKVGYGRAVAQQHDQAASTVETVAPSATPSPSLQQALHEMQSQLNALQQGLDATQQQVRTLLLLRHQRRRPWRALVQAYWGLVCGFCRLGSRRSS
jgi:hypothetical protein